MNIFKRNSFFPQDVDCVKEWVYCQKFNTFFKLLLFAIVVNTSFSIFRFYEGNIPMVQANVIAILVFSFFIFILQKFHNTYHIFTRLFLVITFLLVTTSMNMADQTSRIIWLLTIAVAAFYFRDQKEGVLWTLFFSVYIILMYYFDFYNSNMIGLVDVITIIANFALVSVMLFWYEKIKIKDQERLEEQNKMLNKKVQERTVELEKLTKKDELTGLSNRRHFYEIQTQLFGSLIRDHKSCIFVMADLDNFKSYNDTYGHLKGDEVLVNVAKVLKKHLERASDYAFRLGGEEFGIIMSGLSAEDAYKHLEVIRQDICDLQIEHTCNEEKVVTMSFGAVHFIPTKDTNFNIIYSEADKKLYKAKESGKNKVLM